MQDRLVEGRGVVDVHAGRAAGQDDGQRLLGEDLVGGERMGNDLGVQMRLADPARDQLCVLRAEVDDQNRTGQIGHAASLSRDGGRVRRPGPVSLSAPRPAD